MSQFFLMLMTFAVVTVAAAKSKTLCGVKVDNVDGNTYLIGKKNFQLNLTSSKMKPSLLNQMNELVKKLGPDSSGNVGTLNGSRYCVTAETANTQVTGISAVWRMGDEIRTFCGRRTGTANNAYLTEGREEIELATQGGDHTLLDQTDLLIESLGPDASGEVGTQVGVRYCINAKIVGETPVQIISAFRE